jgi:hypothetical protein
MRDTIDMARESKIYFTDRLVDVISMEDLKRFEALVRADDREACAKVADHYSMHDQDTPADIAEAIRAREIT